ncbi:MAG: succinate dehydrogenase, hydrophobic membrane anchor protein [Alphaproteobacteria bacterium]|nr:succinate dehydrogenase, hydrophobic membrane anchor protein [Alphaproteobacteria bacterium]
MTLRSPLGRVRGLGAAKDGTAHWWAQRITAAALVPLTIWFVASIAAMAGAGHAAVLAWVANPVVAILLILLVIATFHHAQLGMQTVIEDYVHHEGTKVVVLVLVKLAAFALGVAAVFAVVRIAVKG